MTSMCWLVYVKNLENIGDVLVTSVRALQNIEDVFVVSVNELALYVSDLHLGPFC